MPKLTKAQFALWGIANIIVALLLFWATERHPYSYYTMLRFVTCGVSVAGFFVALHIKRQVEPWLYGAVALLFNPIIPVHLSKSIWQPIDIIVGIGFLISAVNKFWLIKGAPSYLVKEEEEKEP